MAIPCPGCGQHDHTRKVLAIVEAGDSMLATGLSAGPPPVRPAQRDRPGVVALGLTVAWLPIAILLAIVARQGFYGFLLILGAVPCAYAIYRLWGTNAKKARWRFQMEDFQAALNRYGNAAAIWQELQYCGRCSGVFLPGYEWQTAVNPQGRMIDPNHAWGYACSLEEHAFRQQAVPVVSDRGLVGSGR